MVKTTFHFEVKHQINEKVQMWYLEVALSSSSSSSSYLSSIKYTYKWVYEVFQYYESFSCYYYECACVTFNVRRTSHNVYKPLPKQEKTATYVPFSLSISHQCAIWRYLHFSKRVFSFCLQFYSVSFATSNDFFETTRNLKL